MRVLFPFLLPALILTAVPDVQAQTPGALGARVRITSPSGTSLGALERVTADSLVVGGQPIARAAISRMEVSAGRKSHWLKGLGIGAVVGAVAGYGGAALATGDSHWGTCRADEVNICPIFAVLGAGAGLVVGGVIGGLSHSERWRALPLGSVSVMPSIGPRGSVGISVGFRF